MSKENVFDNYSTKDCDSISCLSSGIKTTNSQLYRKEWERLEIFKGWLRGVPNDSNRAYCIYCEKSFRAHRTDLRIHARSEKHKKFEFIYHNKQFIVNKFNKSYCKNRNAPLSTVNYAGDSLNVLDENQTKLISSRQSTYSEKSIVTVDCYTASEKESQAEIILHNNSMQIHKIETVKTPYDLVVANEIETVKHIPKLCQKTDNLFGCLLPSNADLGVEVLTSNNYNVETSESDERGRKIHQPGLKNSWILNRYIHDGECQDPADGSISTQIVDISNGEPIGEIPVMLYSYVNDAWTLLSESVTDSSGFCRNLLPVNVNLSVGLYKLRILTQQYYLSSGLNTLWPHIEVSLEVVNRDQHYHIPIAVGPYEYMVNRV